MLVRRGLCYFQLKVAMLRSRPADHWMIRPAGRSVTTPDVQAQNAEKAGAAAVIIYNSNKGQPPFPMAAPAGGADVNIPCCMTWASQGEEIAR